MTPEGKIKKKVKALLDATPGLYYDMPVPGGFGRSGLDFNGCHRGRAFYIETKDAGKDLTPRQKYCALRMLASGAVVFVVSDEMGLWALSAFLVRNCASAPLP